MAVLVGHGDCGSAMITDIAADASRKTDKEHGTGCQTGHDGYVISDEQTEPAPTEGGVNK
jgi:hypothetical protein